MDVLTPEQRHKNMSHIRSKGTKPEKTVRSLLHKMGYRFRLHVRDLPGSPDIVLKRYKTVIFVHGCFWHRHEGCRFSTTPATNTSKWIKKFHDNTVRDELNLEKLHGFGWNTIIVWECETRDLKLLELKLKNGLKKIF